MAHSLTTSVLALRLRWAAARCSAPGRTAAGTASAAAAAADGQCGLILTAQPLAVVADVDG